MGCATVRMPRGRAAISPSTSTGSDAWAPARQRAAPRPSSQSDATTSRSGVARSSAPAASAAVVASVARCAPRASTRFTAVISAMSSSSRRIRATGAGLCIARRRPTKRRPSLDPDGRRAPWVAVGRPATASSTDPCRSGWPPRRVASARRGRARRGRGRAPPAWGPGTAGASGSCRAVRSMAAGAGPRRATSPPSAGRAAWASASAVRRAPSSEPSTRAAISRVNGGYPSVAGARAPPPRRRRSRGDGQRDGGRAPG